MNIESLLDLLPLTAEMPQEPPRGIQPVGEEGQHESDPCWCPGD